MNDAVSISAISLFAPSDAAPRTRSGSYSTEDDDTVYLGQAEPEEERLLTQEERDSFFKPRPQATLQLTSSEFVPTITTNFCKDLLNKFAALEPAFWQKQKTEICKFWLNGGECKFGPTCCFAHGESELLKKTHVPSKFRMSFCKSYMQAPFYCQYGTRCQFCHV